MHYVLFYMVYIHYILKLYEIVNNIIIPILQTGNRLRKSTEELALGHTINERQYWHTDPSHSVFALSALPMCDYILRTAEGSRIRPRNGTARSHHEPRRSLGLKKENNYPISLTTK